MERSESLGDRCGGGGSIFREEGARGQQGSPVGWAPPGARSSAGSPKRQVQAGKQEQGMQNTGKRQPGKQEEHWRVQAMLKLLCTLTAKRFCTGFKRRFLPG